MIIQCAYAEHKDRDIRCVITEDKCLSLSNPLECPIIDQELWQLTHVLTLQEVWVRDLKAYFRSIQESRILRNYKTSKKNRRKINR